MKNNNSSFSLLFLTWCPCDYDCPGKEGCTITFRKIERERKGEKERENVIVHFSQERENV